MPQASKWGIRMALIYLVAGSTLGSAVSLAKTGVIDARAWGWLTPHFELMMFGWMTQFAISVAFWMLPRLQGGRRGRVAWFVAALVGLNVGTLLATWGVAVGDLVILLALGCFLFHAHPRVTRLSPAELRNQ